MKIQKQTALDRFNAIDRMINEGLGNGTIVPKYDEAHLQLKEKEESLVLKSEEKRGGKK